MSEQTAERCVTLNRQQFEQRLRALSLDLFSEWTLGTQDAKDLRSGVVAEILRWVDAQEPPGCSFCGWTAPEHAPNCEVGGSNFRQPAQEPPAETTRLRELARKGASYKHYSDGVNKGHTITGFDTCPHPDCQLVRRKP